MVTTSQKSYISILNEKLAAAKLPLIEVKDVWGWKEASDAIKDASARLKMSGASVSMSPSDVASERQRAAASNLGVYLQDGATVGEANARLAIGSLLIEFRPSVVSVDTDEDLLNLCVVELKRYQELYRCLKAFAESSPQAYRAFTDARKGTSVPKDVSKMSLMDMLALKMKSVASTQTGVAGLAEDQPS